MTDHVYPSKYYVMRHEASDVLCLIADLFIQQASIGRVGCAVVWERVIDSSSSLQETREFMFSVHTCILVVANNYVIHNKVLTLGNG